MNSEPERDRSRLESAFEPGHDLSMAQFHYLARGFTFVFWGLLLSLILFLSNASLEVFRHIQVPAYAIGSVLVCWGLLRLMAAGVVSVKWRGYVRIVIALVFLELYFAPFAEWWKTNPSHLLFLGNFIGLILAGMLALFFFNLLVAELAWRLKDNAGRREARLFALSVLLLMVVPLLGLVIYSMVMARRYPSSFYLEICCSLRYIPLWVYFFVTVPCSLTLIALWKARDQCYSRLWARRNSE